MTQGSPEQAAAEQTPPSRNRGVFYFREILRLKLFIIAALKQIPGSGYHLNFVPCSFFHVTCCQLSCC
jgi:hypothetical protein